MARNTKNMWYQTKFQSTRTIKRYLALFGVMLVAVALIVCFSSASVIGSSVQSVNIAGSETQFVFDIVYAYTGQGPSDASYTAANGALMSPKSQNPSAVIFNITRLPDNQITSCDAIIEVYNVKIATDTGTAENHCYFIGTNYDPSFSDSELSTLFVHVNDLASISGSTVVRGNFEFNWTQNTPFLSLTVGSVGYYSSGVSGLGLMRNGVPNSISVTVNRIGYITMSGGLVSIYRDTPILKETAAVQLGNYGDGFLHNTLIPADKLPRTNLFHPNS